VVAFEKAFTSFIVTRYLMILWRHVTMVDSTYKYTQIQNLLMYQIYLRRCVMSNIILNTINLMIIGIFMTIVFHYTNTANSKNIVCIRYTTDNVQHNIDTQEISQSALSATQRCAACVNQSCSSRGLETRQAPSDVSAVALQGQFDTRVPAVRVVPVSCSIHLDCTPFRSARREVSRRCVPGKHRTVTALQIAQYVCVEP
jgi:hypothetical protein